VFLLLAMPGLLALSRSSVREVRVVSFGTGVVIVLLMWGECLRLALDHGLEQWGVLEPLAREAKIQFCLVCELCWWWTVSVMLAACVRVANRAAFPPSDPSRLLRPSAG